MHVQNFKFEELMSLVGIEPSNAFTASCKLGALQEDSVENMKLKCASREVQSSNLHPSIHG
jgi:hypothetical protein